MSEPYYIDESVTLWYGDALDVLRTLPTGAVDCCITSPPYYGLRDYGIDGQQGLEASPAEYVAGMVAVFAEVRRVLADDGTLWLNIGDKYAWAGGHTSPGSKPSPLLNSTGRKGEDQRAGQTRHWSGGQKPPDGYKVKDLIGIPWEVAFALRTDGWTLRNAIVWHKPNAMPESVTDRLACRYEHVFLLSKSRHYWFDLDAIREPLAFPEALDGTRVFGGANKGSHHRTGPGAAKRRTGNRYGDAPTEQQDRRIIAATGDQHDDVHPKGRNPGDVWTVPTQPFSAAHFAVMPLKLAERCVQAGCKPGGIVLDPYSGSGTTGLAAARHGRRYVGIDLNADYLDLSLRTRLAQAALLGSDDAEGVAG